MKIRDGFMSRPRLLVGLRGSAGPTAAFVVILAPIAARFGLGGLCVATLLAGLLLIAMGWMQLGQWIDVHARHKKP